MNQNSKVKLVLEWRIKDFLWQTILSVFGEVVMLIDKALILRTKYWDSKGNQGLIKKLHQVQMIKLWILNLSEMWREKTQRELKKSSKIKFSLKILIFS